MTDIKGMSSVSYCSERYTKSVFDDLVASGWVEEYFFIRHKAEEGEKKDHLHVFWLPLGKNHRGVDYREKFHQLVDDDGSVLEKPLGMMPVQSSVFGHWLLYSLHDRDYLMSKGEVRRYTYSLDDVRCRDRDVLERLWYTVGLHYSEYVRKTTIDVHFINQLFAQGYTVYDILDKGLCPGYAVHQLKSLESVYAEQQVRIGRQHEIDEAADGLLRDWMSFYAVESLDELLHLEPDVVSRLRSLAEYIAKKSKREEI